MMKDPGSQIYTHAMSSDGSRVYFQSGGNLYVRLQPGTSLRAPSVKAGCAANRRRLARSRLTARRVVGNAGGGEFKWATP